MPARRLDEEDGDEQVPGECELKALTASRSRSQSFVVAIEGFSPVFSSWSIANSESFDNGELCGKAHDRTTPVTSFEQALERGDGRGFGSPLFYRMSFFQGAGGIVDTEISSSAVTAVKVTGVSGAPGDVPPATVGYGQTFYTSHVAFSDDNGLLLSFPLLFHDHAGCLGDDVDLDVYSSAVLGYGSFLGGNVTSVPALDDDTDEFLASRDRYNSIFLGTEALLEYAATQALCDVTSAPVWTEEAGYAMCSGATEVFFTSDGDIATSPTFPNVTTSVGGCPISVLPARFVAVGDFIDGTLDSRLSQWPEAFTSVQRAIFSQNVDASAALETAVSPVVQSSTQIGFALPEANNSTEWVLVLVVAVESLFVVVTALAALVFSASNCFILRRGSTPRREWVTILGAVFVLGAFLVLGLTPVFIGWASEQEAAEMAHNDVYHYTVDASVCAEATWEGDGALGQWCVALRTSSSTLLVRSYVSTFEDRYAALAWCSAVLGGASWLTYAVLKTVFVEKVNRSVGAVSGSGYSEARPDFRA